MSGTEARDELRQLRAEVREQLAAIVERLKRIEAETVACRKHREGGCQAPK